MGPDDDQHLEADIPMSVIPGDAAYGIEQQTAIHRCGTHNIVHECVTRCRDAKELTREDTTSSVMLAMEFEAVETIDTHSSTSRFHNLEHPECMKSLAWL